MDWLVVGIVAAAIVLFAVIGQRKGWVDFTTSGARKRSGNFTMPLGPFDEVFQPTRYEAQLQQDRETVLPAPAPAPGDPDKDVYQGNVKIRVPKD